ncbi:MAG: lipoate--protein ligase family protein [Candidatus Aminicenantes bacterium]|nr:lipoate--protein ligase family protein [Candidatus Aminicenantes bacterium]
MPEWFLLPDLIPYSAAENMARDEYLFQLCHTKKCGFLRFYSWDKPTFSFGVSQKISKAVNLKFLEQNHCSFVRRITGGKTVLHNDEITYAVVSSEDTFYRDNDLYKSYLLISRVIVRAFENIGVEAYLCKSHSSAYARTDHPCFSFPTLNEIEINGKKIVGSAQKRDKFALLQHGSIPITMDYKLYSGGSNANKNSLERRMTTFSEVSGKSKDELLRSLIASFRDFLKLKFESYFLNRDDNNEIKKLTKKYNSRDWNFSL